MRPIQPPARTGSRLALFASAAAAAAACCSSDAGGSSIGSRRRLRLFLIQLHLLLQFLLPLQESFARLQMPPRARARLSPAASAAPPPPPPRRSPPQRPPPPPPPSAAAFSRASCAATAAAAAAAASALRRVRLASKSRSRRERPRLLRHEFRVREAVFVLGNTTGTGNKSDDVEGEEDDEGTVFDLSERLPGRSRKRRRTRLTTPLAASIAFPTPSLAAAIAIASASSLLPPPFASVAALPRRPPEEGDEGDKGASFEDRGGLGSHADGRGSEAARRGWRAIHASSSFSSSFSGDSGDDEDDENGRRRRTTTTTRGRGFGSFATRRRSGNGASPHLVRDARTLFVFRASAAPPLSPAAPLPPPRPPPAARRSSRHAWPPGRPLLRERVGALLAILAALSRDAWSTEKQHGTRKIKQATKDRGRNGGERR